MIAVTYQPQRGDIGLVRIEGYVGQLIRFGQWLNADGFKNYSHAFVYVGDGKIIEAMPGGALLSPLSRYDDQTVLWLRCPDQCGAAVAEAARSFGPQRDESGHLIKRGVPYSWTDYGALALHRFHIPTPHLKKFIARSKSMICSQLADRAARLGGWKIFDDGRDPGDVTPADLAREALRQAVTE